MEFHEISPGGLPALCDPIPAPIPDAGIPWDQQYPEPQECFSQPQEYFSQPQEPLEKHPERSHHGFSFSHTQGFIPGFFSVLITGISPPCLREVWEAWISPSAGNPTPTPRCRNIPSQNTPRGAAPGHSQLLDRFPMGSRIPECREPPSPAFPVLGCAPTASATFGSHKLWKTTQIWEL